MDSLLAQINRQLSIQGLYIRAGEISIIDASVIQAQRNRPNKDKDGTNTQDPEAGWNVKQGSDGKRKSTYSFKAHANIDEDGFIKATAFTAGNVHDSNHLHYGMGQARYLRLARNSIRFGMMCLAYNLRRGANIKKFCETSHYSCA